MKERLTHKELYSHKHTHTNTRSVKQNWTKPSYANKIGNLNKN